MLDDTSCVGIYKILTSKFKEVWFCVGSIVDVRVEDSTDVLVNVKHTRKYAAI